MSKVFLNSWYFYNEGSIGFGWMDTDEARTFMEEHEDDTRYEEWFIADIDNDTGFDFGKLEYKNVDEVLDGLDLLDGLLDWEQKEVVALAEYLGSEDAEDVYSERDRYIIYSNVDSYYDSCDELIECYFQQGDIPDVIERYFDWDSYHRDCMYDAYEAENGVVICE